MDRSDSKISMDSVLDSNGSHELLRCSTEELALLRDAQLRSPQRRTSPRSPRSRLNSGDLREMKSAVREAVAEVRKASPRGGRLQPHLVRAGVRAVAALDDDEFHHATVFLFQQDVLVVQIL